MDEAELAAAPRVTLAGCEFPVPDLPWRRTMQIAELQQEIAGIQAKGGNALDKMLDIIVIGIGHATPATKRADFVDKPIRMRDIQAAIKVVLLQSGLVEQADLDKQGGQGGLAKNAEAESGRTGTA